MEEKLDCEMSQQIYVKIFSTRKSRELEFSGVVIEIISIIEVQKFECEIICSISAIFLKMFVRFFLLSPTTALSLLCCKPINIFIFVSHAIKFGDSFYPSRLQEKYIILCKPVLFFRVVRSSACKYLFIGIYPKENSIKVILFYIQNGITHIHKSIGKYLSYLVRLLPILQSGSLFLYTSTQVSTNTSTVRCKIPVL